MRSPAFPFYPSDFLTGTDEMSSVEVGLYIRMLSYQWLRPEGGLPAEHGKIIRLARWESEELPPAVMRKFVASEDGLLRNPRLEQERQKRESYQKQQTELANRRWNSNGHSQKPPETPANPPGPARFTKPTLEEVKLLMAKSGLPESEAQGFMDHYESNGWKVGRTKMVSVGGAVGTWAKNHREKTFKPAGAKSATRYVQPNI